MLVLIAEDDEPKLERITSFVHDCFEGTSIESCKSFNSALRRLKSQPSPDLLLLDMTLPTFDVGPNEAGYRPKNFGGKEILRQMKRFSIGVPTIVVTQFEEFGTGTERMTKDQLDSELSDAFGFYRGMVYYSAAITGWRDSLRKRMSDIISPIDEGR